jgi:hypothetical protein
MNSKIVVLILCAFFSSTRSQATVITEHQCVDSSPKAVHKLFTQYDQYSKLPGAEYSVSLAGVEVPLMHWVKSQAKLISESATQSENYVWTVLQPVNLTDSTLYPRFLLDCKVEWQGQSGFRQICSLMKDKQHFALDDFQIRVEAATGSSKCKANETGIDIHIELIANSKQVGQIKSAVLAPAGILAPLIEPLFNEEAFFKNYFHYVYGEWMKSL